MNHKKIKYLIIMALCCDLGIVGKKLIAPIANLITESIHIPGGIGTSFSLMFIVIAVSVIPRTGVAVIMSIVQSILSVALGTVGSMGILSPLGYILPGICIDVVFWIFRRFRNESSFAEILANAMASVAASLTSNYIVFHLSGLLLIIYLMVSFLSGIICGFIASMVSARIRRLNFI